MRKIPVNWFATLAIAPLRRTVAECVFWRVQCVHRFSRCLRMVAGILTVVAEIARRHRVQQLAAIVFAVHRIQIGFGPIRMQSLV